jgi:mRNA interferase RelE/StbE
LTTSRRATIASKVPSSPYRLAFVPEALAEYRALDGSIRTVLKKLLAKRLVEPHVPGGELHGDLSRCYKIKLLKQGIRLVYEVEDSRLVVLVLAVDKREDSAAYKSAMARLTRTAVAALERKLAAADRSAGPSASAR